MRIAAVGDNCMDVYESMGKEFPGGNPVNVAVYLRRLGVDASYCGVVGTDKYGPIMIERLREKGVDTTHLHTQEGATAVTYVELKNGNRVFGDYIEGVMEHFTLTGDDIDFLAGHDLVVSGIWGNVHMDMPKIREKGALVAFDFSDQPQHEVVGLTIANVDYAFFAFDEESDEEVKAYIKDKQEKGPKVVVATLGARGSIAYDGKDFHTFGIVDCEVVDTMGAGDSYIAGFLKGILEEKPVPECMRLGAENSSITIAYQGAW